MQFQPSHYTLSLVPDKQTMKFTGTVTIRGKKVGRPSQRITLHGKGLKVGNASVVRHGKKGDEAVELERVNLQKSYDEIRLHAAGMIYPGEYTLTLEFSGDITRGMTGIYPCFFKVDGKEHALIMTQFESHYAREAFPCIDEPEAKATYDLTLSAPAGEVVLGNTPIKLQKTEGKTTITTFETTPKMSSYLLAFVIGELHNKSTKTNRGTDVAVWGTIAQPAEAFDFSLEIAKRSIEFFEEFFGVEYPLPKADHVAVPDFSAGAMENWGLITYRERALLVYPGETAQSIQEYIATVVAHETSHQWFGNLVTMKWWNDLWLNESFADIMEYEAPDHMHPEWHVWDTFISNEALGALRRDATPGVQAVRTTVNHPEEISTLFDPSIVYAKGGRLLNMMKQYLGLEAFRKGLNAYFTAHAYGNTTGADLWAALSKASGKDVAAFMDPWLERSGFPVLTLKQEGNSLTIRQEHFSDNPAKADKERLWPVPLFANNPAVPELLTGREATVELKDSEPVLINQGAHGHYIVNYADDAQREALGGLIRAKKLSNGERLMLLNDASMLARSGLRSYRHVLELLEIYEDEDSEPVWDMMALIISETRRFIDQDEALETKIKAFIRRLIAKEYARLGWDAKPNEDAGDQKLRATIIGLGAYAEDPEITREALKRFEAYRSAGTAIAAELRSIVFSVPVKQGGKEAVDFLLELHHTTSNSDLQADICAALTATRSPEGARRLLERIKDPDLVKPQDADRWLIYLLRNRYTGDTAWQWMAGNWDWIVDTYANDKSYDMLPRYAAGACNTEAQAKRYREFFEPKESEIVLKRNIQIGLEEIDSRVAWLERDLSSVRGFFQQF